MRWLVGLVVALACASCTSVYDLHSVSNVDHDNDGVDDAIDNCPEDFNPDQSDYNHNAMGDVCDPACADGGPNDVDHDGIPDLCDGCIGTGVDADGDHIDDGCDLCVGNGIDDDSDGIPDNCDDCVGSGVDADHDGIDDVCDSCVQTFADQDQDGIDDGCDPCVGPPGDADGDGVQDACDPCPAGPQHDEDGDTHYDACDKCPAIADSQTDSGELVPDGVGDACDISTVADEQDFDPFTSVLPAWYLQGTNWSIHDDAAFVTPSVFGPSIRMHPHTVSSALAARTLVTFDAPFDFGTDERVAIMAADAVGQPATTLIECAVGADGGLIARTLVNGIETLEETTGPDPAVPFVLALEDMGGGKAKCKAGDAEITFGAPTGGPLYAGLVADHVSVHFAYFDLVSR